MLSIVPLMNGEDSLKPVRVGRHQARPAVCRGKPFALGFIQ